MRTTQPRLQLVVDARAPEWKLDDVTKQTGKRGVAAARDAMRRHGPAGRQDGRHDDGPDHGPSHPHAA